LTAGGPTPTIPPAARRRKIHADIVEHQAPPLPVFNFPVREEKSDRAGEPERLLGGHAGAESHEPRKLLRSHRAAQRGDRSIIFLLFVPVPGSSDRPEMCVDVA
jgi:hypothetical protein